MTKERDLLPWIFGSLSAATVALAAAAIATHATPTQVTVPTAVVASATTALPTAALTPISVPALAPAAASAAVADSTPAPAAGEPEVQPAQIWECTTQGVKTFSNNPCGEKPSLLEVGPINSMHATPPPRLAYGYAPPSRYAQPSYADARASSYDEEDTDQGGSESGGDSYSIVQGVAFMPRRHPGHHRPHQPPYQHHSVSAPRKF